jgi:hypothetical protein
MRREQTKVVRDVADERDPNAKPVRRLPPRRATTKQMHERLLRALRDRRVKRAFD